MKEQKLPSATHFSSYPSHFTETALIDAANGLHTLNYSGLFLSF